MVPKDALCFFRDGNQWCCVWGDFKNLQESNAGFGDTMDAASLDLRLKESRNWPVEVTTGGLTPVRTIRREVNETVERARSSYSSTDLGARVGLGISDED